MSDSTDVIPPVKGMVVSWVTIRKGGLYHKALRSLIGAYGRGHFQVNEILPNGGWEDPEKAGKARWLVTLQRNGTVTLPVSWYFLRLVERRSMFRPPAKTTSA